MSTITDLIKQARNINNIMPSKTDTALKIFEMRYHKPNDKERRMIINKVMEKEYVA